MLPRPGGEHGGQLGDLLTHQGREILVTLQHHLVLLVLLVLEVLEMLMLEAGMIKAVMLLVLDLTLPLLIRLAGPSSSASNH